MQLSAKMQQQSEVGVLPVIRTIGFFGVNELDADPIVSPEAMEDFLRPIAWSKINRIHRGEGLEVGQNCEDFPPANLDDAQVAILSNTERIERAVRHFKPDSKSKPKVFARTAVLCDLATATLHPKKNRKSKEFEFAFNKDKKELKIWAIESRRYMKSAGCGPFVETTLTTEREMPADELVYHGHQATYQLTELFYPEFVVYASKEIDAIDKVKKGDKEFSVYEIKSCSNLKNFRIDNILIKNVAFAKINKLIIGELEQQGETAVIKQIRVVENIESLDSSNLVEACRRELGKVLDSILDLVKDFPNGILSVSHQGIQLFNGSNGRGRFIKRAIATKSFSPKMQNGEPLGHKINHIFFNQSDVQYILDPTYKFNSTWPCRDTQGFEDFLENGFTNRKKEKYVLLFSKTPQIHLKTRAKLEEEGYFYDQIKSTWLRNEYSEVLDCFVLEETLEN